MATNQNPTVTITPSVYFCTDCQRIQPFAADMPNAYCDGCGAAFLCQVCGYEIDRAGRCQRPDGEELAKAIDAAEEAEFAKGVGTAVAALTLAELKAFRVELTDPQQGATVAQSVQAMLDEGWINLGWINDFGSFDPTVDDPEATGLVAVATLATRTGEDACALYHRIIGVDL